MEVKNLLHDDNKTKEYLNANCICKKTCKNDFFEIARILCNNMGVNNPLFTIQQLIDTNVVLDESIKIIDPKDNRIYGILILSKYDIQRGSPIQERENDILYVLNGFNQINGFLFIIDERLRGCGFDKKMIEMALPHIEQHDLIWVAVDKSLRTHNYWKRLGLYEVLDIPQAKFYCKILNNNALIEMYRRIEKKRRGF